MRFILLCLLSSAAQAFIPKGMTILHKVAENTGSGSYVIEQEVQFAASPEPFVLKETWVIDSDSQMKLYVSGTKEWKDSIHWQVNYSAGQKTVQFGNKRQVAKLTEDFIEKYFHFRSSENFANTLIQMKIVPPSLLNRRAVRTLKDLDDQSESFVRLSRVGGVIGYAFGAPASLENSDRSAGFWFEQDQFVLRKFRLNSGVEVQAEKFSPYPRGLNFPRKRTVRWENSQVQIQTLSVSGKSSGHGNSIEVSKVDGLDLLPVKATILEFYSRYR